MDYEQQSRTYTRAEIASRIAEEGRIISSLVLSKLTSDDKEEYSAEAVRSTVVDEGRIIQRVVADHFEEREER